MPRAAAVRKQTSPATKPATKLASVRSTRNDLEAAEQQVGQDHPRVMRSRGPARQSLEPTRVQPVERVPSKEKLEALAFMEEIVTVLVHDSTNPTDEKYPEVWNDGKVQRFPRGVEHRVKRKFVEVLARAKKTAYTQEKYKDGNGDDAYRQIPHTALKYPFAVIEDTPKGKAWLKSILAEA